MNKVKYLFIHCSDTKISHYITGEDIKRWHTLPEPQGRGWSKVGYNYFIRTDGTLDTLISFDDNGIVEWNEIANGVKSFNDKSYHICYAGGQSYSGNPLDTRTGPQVTTMSKLIKEIIAKFPDIIIVGHYQAYNTTKTCPNFDVPSYLRSIGVPEKNIKDGKVF